MVCHEDKKWMKKVYREKSDDLVWERLLKIMREIVWMWLKKGVTKNHQGWGFDGQIGVRKDPTKIGDLIEGQYLIYIDLWFGLGCLHRLPLSTSPTRVRTDLANRPTEPMLVSIETRYMKLWGNHGFLQSGSRQTTPVRVGVTCGSGISVVRVDRIKRPR